MLGLVCLAAAPSHSNLKAGQQSEATSTATSSLEPDWKSLDPEALGYLRRYLQFDTANPPGNTVAAISYLKGILDKEGIATEVYASTPDKPNLVARLPGPSGTKPFLMMSHADVVPANAAQWSHPPFAADIAGGFVWARGATDDKAHGIMALMAMLTLKRLHVPLRRGVEMMVNSDEEVGGGSGAAWFVKSHWQSIDPAFAVNEGGDGTTGWLGCDATTFRVAVAEKSVMWLRLRAHGRAGHGSEPNDDNPNIILLNALSRLLASPPPFRVTPVFARAAATVAPRTTFPASFELSHLNAPLMLYGALRGPLSGYMVQALLRDTITPTVLASGFKVNVIPSTAEAELDCRLLPGADPVGFLTRIRDLLSEPRITIEFIQQPEQAPASPITGEAWDAIAQVVSSDFPGSLTVPSMTAGGTDSRFLRRLRVPAYGFIPIVLDGFEARRIHGVDERLSLENFDRGVRASYHLALQLCALHP